MNIDVKIYQALKLKFNSRCIYENNLNTFAIILLRY